ncbi:hypothetical protein PGTUg99_029599 [Puccinia graminis f. sp. tritici]|uniref:Uncharacterized protein n=1 Tax=Puccinia graminis f. sp. tritici TaxID=56615 RepID=A0A5B0SL81_PUCGR|nr:hypothetical protein PGTUg99_029599 [Puccinia graminis f. sp. tritici]
MKQPINQAAKRIARILGDKATRSQSPRTTATARTKRRTARHPPPLHTESATQPDQHYSPESYKTPANQRDQERDPVNKAPKKFLLHFLLFLQNSQSAVIGITETALLSAKKHNSSFCS